MHMYLDSRSVGRMMPLHQPLRAPLLAAALGKGSLAGRPAPPGDGLRDTESRRGSPARRADLPSHGGRPGLMDSRHSFVQTLYCRRRTVNFTY